MTSSGLSILMHWVMSLTGVRSYDKHYFSYISFRKVGNVPFQVYDHFRELNTGYELDKEKRLCQASKRENLSSGFPTS